MKMSMSYYVDKLDDWTYMVNTMRDVSDSEAEDPAKGKKYTVKADLANGIFFYECCKLERDSILCCHIIRVIGVYGVKEVPEHYILRRCTWNANEALGHDGTQELNTTQQGMPRKSNTSSQKCGDEEELYCDSR